MGIDETSALDPVTQPTDDLKERIIDALKTVYDPEIPVNIYDLGLIYNIGIDAEAHVHLQMTLTAPGCPVAQTFPGVVENAVKAVNGVKDAAVELVWDPPWSRERMSEAALLQLGML
ncbi:MAG: SUF system Fe-S cluster assembly protein [Gammaproteobacteria bacterium]|nr:SUF system Fe-S cluster assembly protein [Gammaproteobacteria bacterium]